MPLLFGFSGLLLCQFLGELLVKTTHLPVPGPVAGMVIMLVALMIIGRVPDGIRLASEGLLKYLTLLYVPAGVGVMVHFDLIGNNFAAIAVTLVVSTIVTQLATLYCLAWMKRRNGQQFQQEEEA